MGSTINDLGGDGENREKKIFEGTSPGKKKFQEAFLEKKKKLKRKRLAQGKKFVSNFFSAPPQIMVEPYSQDNISYHLVLIP